MFKKKKLENYYSNEKICFKKFTKKSKHNLEKRNTREM